jgi:hypothetical protein
VIDSSTRASPTHASPFEPGCESAFRSLLALSQNIVTVSPAKNAAEARGGSETILVVEDDRTLRTILRTILGDRGYHVLVADCGEAARAAIASSSRAIDLILTTDRTAELQPSTMVLYIQKPFTGDKLAHSVRDLLDRIAV